MEVFWMPRFKEMPLDRSQLMLYGRSVEDAVPSDCDVRGFGDVMSCLDYSRIESKCCERGCPAYPPQEMVKVVGYAYLKGIRSSRRIEEHLNFDVRFIWLAGGLKPDHNTIARFRKGNWEELKDLIGQSARLCCEAGLVYLNVACTDGSKMRAAASSRRIYNKSRVEREMAAVEKILQEAEEADRLEDEADAGGGDGKMPEHLRDANKRKQRLAEIAKQLESSGSKHVVASEPDSRVMKMGDTKRPGYNLQASVDAENQVILAAELTQDENDYGRLPQMESKVECETGMCPDAMITDAGYPDEQTLRWSELTKTDVVMPVGEHWRAGRRSDGFAARDFVLDGSRDVMICPAGQELVFRGEFWTGSSSYRRYEGTQCRGCAFFDRCVSKGYAKRRMSVSVVERQRRAMRAKLASEEGKRLYALRNRTVEPVFGQIKSNLGLSKFLLYGLEGATAEVGLMCTVHNVLKCMASKAAMAYIRAQNASAVPAGPFGKLFSAIMVQAKRAFAIPRVWHLASALAL
jgi:transposase